VNSILLPAAILIGLFSGPAIGDSANCRLAVRTTFKSGKKKIEVLEVPAKSREDCRRQARARETASSKGDIQSIQVSFGWRELDSKR
jgi:hypothetical protein